MRVISTKFYFVTAKTRVLRTEEYRTWILVA
jgi:hypothetical protein